MDRCLLFERQRGVQIKVINGKKILNEKQNLALRAAHSQFSW